MSAVRRRVAMMLWAALAVGACHRDGRPAEPALTIFHAGSLSVPFRELSDLFHRRHPRVRILAEAAGSRDTARKVSDLGRACDVLGSADYKVVENLLVPRHATFNVRFATGEMVIAYTERSRHADLLTPRSWPDLLLRPEVTFGRSDPNRDPCGYRTEMLFQLAERHYGSPGLAAKLARKGGRRYIRPKETDLLALLESGEIDYLFIYRSVATQHRLRQLLLPDEINLGAPKMAARYHDAVVQVTGQRPGEMIERRGSPIVYSVTVPSSARNGQLGLDYLSLLLSPAGQAVMRKNGQPPIAPARCTGAIPAQLRPYCGSGAQ